MSMLSFQLTKRILENKTKEEEIAKLLEDTKSKEVGIKTPQITYGILFTKTPQRSLFSILVQVN